MSTEPIQSEHNEPTAQVAAQSPLAPLPADVSARAPQAAASSPAAQPLPPRIDGGEDLDNVLGEVSRLFGQADGHSAPLAALAEDTINDHVSDLTAVERPEAPARAAVPRQEAPLNSAADLFRAAPAPQEAPAAEPESGGAHHGLAPSPPTEVLAEPQSDVAIETPLAEIANVEEPAPADESVAEKSDIGEPPTSDEQSTETPESPPPAFAADSSDSVARPSLVSRIVRATKRVPESLRHTAQRLPKRAKLVAGLLAAVLLGWIGGSLLTHSHASQSAIENSENGTENSLTENATEQAKITALEEQLEKAKHDRELAQHERDQARQRLDQSSMLLKTEKQTIAAERARDESARRRAGEDFQRAEERAQLMELRAYDALLGRVRDCWQRSPGLAAALLENSEGCPPKLRDFAWGYFYGRSKNDRTTWRGNSPSNAVAWSPDGTLVASAGQDGAITLRDAVSGEQVASLAAHAGGVRGLAFSQHGEWLASGGADSTVKLWNVSSRHLEATFFGHMGSVLSVAISPDSSSLVSGGDDGTVKFWDVASRRATATRWGHPRNHEPDNANDPTRFVRAVAYSPDGTLVASGGYQALRIWDATGLERATIGVPDGAVGALAFSPDSRTLAAGSEGSICLRDVDSLLVRSGPQAVDAPVTGLAFSPDGAWLTAATGAQGLIFNRIPRPTEDSPRKKRLNLTPEPAGYDLENPRRLLGHDGLVTGVGFAPSGLLAVTSGTDGTLRLWDPRGKIVDKTQPDVVLREVPPAAALAYSPNSRCLAVGTADSIRLWDMRNTVEMARLENRSGDINRLAFSPDGTHLASASHDWPILIWTISGQQVELALNGHTASVNSLAYSGDGKTLISAGDDASVRLWNAGNGQAIAALTGHTGPVLSATLSPDGKLAASGGADRTIRFWNVEHKQPVATLTGPQGPVVALSFSPNGRFLISAEGSFPDPRDAKPTPVRRPLRLWQIPERKEILAFGPGALDVSDAVFSPDSKTLAVSGPSGVTLWDPRTGEVRGVLRPVSPRQARPQGLDAGQRSAWPIAFSPDGRSLAFGGGNPLAIWTAAPFASAVGEKTVSQP